MSVCECVSEVSEEEDGRAGEAADTELKTKTPHVNVGKTNPATTQRWTHSSWKFQCFLFFLVPVQVWCI